MCVCERVCVREEKIPAYPQKSRISVQKSSIVLFRIDAGTYYMYVRVQVRITCTYVCMYVLHVRTCACTYYMYVRVQVRITCTYVCEAMCVREQRIFCIFAKEPYISANKPCISAKEPNISAKEPYISAKEPYISAKEPCLELMHARIICMCVKESVREIEEK